MNYVIKLFRILFAATMVAMIALPAAAQTQKLQTVTMTSVGTNSKSTVTWNKLFTAGRQFAISSARIDMSADATNAGWIIVGATSSAGTVAWTNTSVTIQKMSPVKPTKAFTVTITCRIGLPRPISTTRILDLYVYFLYGVFPLWR
jgi:hypothetical protein